MAVCKLDCALGEDKSEMCSQMIIFQTKGVLEAIGRAADFNVQLAEQENGPRSQGPWGFLDRARQV